MDLDRFRDDVYVITERLASNMKKDNLPKLNYVRQRLIDLYRENLVKINHSVLELICAANLISRGFSVEVEKPLSDILICDIFAKKGDGTTIIEIETGFTPPDHALDTVNYYVARIISKVARYSKFCSKFSLATPVIGLLPIPRLFLKPPMGRENLEIKNAKLICDRYYKNPPIEYNDCLNARLHSIFLINIDKNFAKEVDPCSYMDLTRSILKKSELEI